MSSRFPKAMFLLVFIAAITSASFAQVRDELKVCADPANLPFSHVNGTGFENRIAELLAKRLNRKVRYHWARMGRGFIRNIVNKGKCDVLIGVPVGMKGVQLTAPYYRSTYVFVTRRGEPKLSSFDDPSLKLKHIGVQVLDDDYAPPARALSRRGLTHNVVGFEMDGDSDGEIVSSVARGKVDTAVVWGPIAGYYAKRYRTALVLTPVAPEVDPPMLQFAYDISVGVSKSKPELFESIQRALYDSKPQIDRILRQYHVPTLPLSSATETLSRSSGKGGL